jgi:hypothetical protein
VATLTIIPNEDTRWLPFTYARVSSSHVVRKMRPAKGGFSESNRVINRRIIKFAKHYGERLLMIVFPCLF